MKLKKYQIDWVAELRGVSFVEAFDEEDARDQFVERINLADHEDDVIYADIENIMLKREK